jgi:ubiquinone/menaquinone biosynthesis C-methylase UbiE
MFGRAAPTYDQIGPRFFARFGRGLVAAADPAPGANVLDVATGRGAGLIPAAERVGPTGHVIGIDLSEGMIAETTARLEQMHLAQAEVRQMDAEHLAFPDETFDVVLCGFSLFFLSDPARALTMFRRVLRPGGRLAVSTWGRDDERWAWLGEFRQKYGRPEFRPPAAGLAFNQPEAMAAALTDAGLSAVQVIEDEAEFYYADEDEWVAVQWSTGMRGFLEMTPPEARERMLAEASARVRAIQQPEGIPHRIWALY